MKKDCTHISVILDRTGSMEAIRDDTIGGFNTFLNQQKGESGYTTMTLIQFDSQDPYKVIHRFTPIDEIPELSRETYVPKATTPLFDAVGRGINDLEKSFFDLNEEERPSKVVFVVVTDGQENASREFRREQIEKMIKDKTENSSWQFVFLSADLAAIGDAMSVGFAADSSLLFAKDSEGSHVTGSPDDLYFHPLIPSHNRNVLSFPRLFPKQLKSCVSTSSPQSTAVWTYEAKSSIFYFKLSHIFEISPQLPHFNFFSNMYLTRS